MFMSLKNILCFANYAFTIFTMYTYKLYSNCYTQQKRITCSGLLKTALNNVLLPTLFNVWTTLDNIEQCWQQNIAEYSVCFQQPLTGFACAFVCVVHDLHVQRHA